jgi:hypothetical protein
VLRQAKYVAALAMTTLPSDKPLNDARHAVVTTLSDLVKALEDASLRVISFNVLPSAAKPQLMRWKRGGLVSELKLGNGKGNVRVLVDGG